jgi:transposase-like protein
MSLQCTSTRAAVRRFDDHFRPKYPNAVAYLRHDLDTRGFRYKFPDQRRALQTTNAIERRFRKVRRAPGRRTFEDMTSMDCVLFASLPRKQISGCQKLFPTDKKQMTLP